MLQILNFVMDYLFLGCFFLVLCGEYVCRVEAVTKEVLMEEVCLVSFANCCTAMR
jgi:hypothetical protein